MSGQVGQLRQSQVITTYGPGALIDLPRQAAIIGGLDSWPNDLEEVVEPRLTRKLQAMTGLPHLRLYAPPPAPREPWGPARGIGAWRFPEWFVVQEEADFGERQRSRRLVHRKALDDRERFEGRTVVPTRFVRACKRGHVDDLDWRGFVHGPGLHCRRQLWLDESGTTGDLSDLRVRCECGKSRSLHEATDLGANPLGPCQGARPWIGRNANEDCGQPSRLLIRSASNAYFPQVVSVLSLPERGTAAVQTVLALWEDLQIVAGADELAFIKKKPKVAEALASFGDAEVLQCIQAIRDGAAGERTLKQAELDALLNAPEGFGGDAPLDGDFHARRLPDAAWRLSMRDEGAASASQQRPKTVAGRMAIAQQSDGIASVIQLHRLREVQALIGFTRLDAVTPDIHGEYEDDVERAEIALEPKWFPAVENRGEGLFIQLRTAAVREWLQRPSVQQRLRQLADGYEVWRQDRKTQRPFPGGPYVLLHSLSHLLIQSLAMRCGYPASSIRERIYAEAGPAGEGKGQAAGQGGAESYGILLYTGTPDAEGTLGGLVQQAHQIEDHLADALRIGALCSNDPICAQHQPGESMEQRWLHGAACHGCTLIAETSCEMRNDYLDRALVVPVLGLADAAFFANPPLT